MELRGHALSEAESFPFLAASQRTGDLLAFSIDNSCIAIPATEAVSGDLIEVSAKRRDINAEHSVF